MSIEILEPTYRLVKITSIHDGSTLIGLYGDCGDYAVMIAGVNEDGEDIGSVRVDNDDISTVYVITDDNARILEWMAEHNIDSDTKH